MTIVLSLLFFYPNVKPCRLFWQRFNIYFVRDCSGFYIVDLSIFPPTQGLELLLIIDFCTKQRTTQTEQSSKQFRYLGAPQRIKLSLVPCSVVVSKPFSIQTPPKPSLMRGRWITADHRFLYQTTHQRLSKVLTLATRIASHQQSYVSLLSRCLVLNWIADKHRSPDRFKSNPNSPWSKAVAVLLEDLCHKRMRRLRCDYVVLRAT